MTEFGNRIDPRVRLFANAHLIFREIQPVWRDFFEELSRTQVLERLASANLIPSTERVVEGFPSDAVVLRQPRLPFVTCPFEWTAGMFRCAASRCLDLHEALLRENLCLQDSHAWNFVFRGATPLWVDVTSISPYDPALVQASLRQFVSSLLNPLVLLSRQQDAVVRALLAHSFSDVADPVAQSILPLSEAPHRGGPARVVWRTLAAQRAILSGLVTRLRHRRHLAADRFKSPSRALEVIDAFRRELATIPLIRRREAWSDYVQSGQAPLQMEERRTATLDADRLRNDKVRSIFQWLSRWQSECSTLLDLACNKGFFAQMGCLLGYTAAGVDSDSGAIESLFGDICEHSLPLVAAVNDMVAPLEALGMSTNPLPPLRERLGADVVMLLATVHHLRWGRYQMRMDWMARLTAGFTRRFAIIEYIPPHDPHLARHYPESASGANYSESEFVEAINREFVTIAVEPSYPEGRKLWILQKRSA